MSCTLYTCGCVICRVSGCVIHAYVMCEWVCHMLCVSGCFMCREWVCHVSCEWVCHVLCVSGCVLCVATSSFKHILNQGHLPSKTSFIWDIFHQGESSYKTSYLSTYLGPSPRMRLAMFTHMLCEPVWFKISTRYISKGDSALQCGRGLE